MNKEEPIRDQAERLRKRIEKKEVPHLEEQSAELPPRSRVHYQKKKKTKFKLKYPVIRLLALFFVLLPIISFSIYTINENNKKATEPVNNEQESIEAVDFEDEQETEGNDSSKVEEEPKESAAVSEDVEVDIGEVEGENISSPSANDKSTINEIDNANKEIVSGNDVKLHTVQPNETLYRIAMKYYQDQSGVEKIKKANGIQGNEIRAGQTLKIPMN